MRILSNLSVSGLLGLNSVADANTDTDKFLVLDSSGIVRYRTGAEVFSDIGAGGAAAYTSVLQHTVKAGEALTKGQAVYVTSADGTNMIVSKASNATEATSSKTLGLIAQNLATNDQGFVVTEGLLAGIDTSTANAGDPVWLGTGGNLLFGLANKPYAPTHMVFIGIVTRVQQNNGEIFVKVQNGFELQELHNVQITSTPSDNTVLAYETSTSLYKMKSIPTLLGYTPTTNARNITINGTTYDLSADRSWSVGTHTGNLTTGYVPKATGITSLTDSLIYDNGSAIGINTASPYESSAFKLDVNGGLLIKNTSGTTAQLVLINSNPATGGNNGFVQLSAGGNTATAFGQWQTYYGMSVAAGALRLQPAGGQVLIGTTTTSAFLTDINGTLRVSGQLTLGSTISNNTYVYTMPGASGTLALVSQIPSLSGYLTIASADATYLTQSSAASIYLSQTSASNTYLTISGAASTYLSQASASNTYLTISGASSIYLSQTNASNTYLTINGASITYLSQTSASNTYLTINNAASNYVSLTSSYANPSWITSLAWSKITGAPAFLTSYTETDTLASVTGRGATTSTLSAFNGGLTTTKTGKSSYAIQIKGAFYGAPRLQLYDLAADSNAFLGLGVDMSTAPYEFSNYFPRYAGMGRWSVGSWAGDFGSGQYVSGYNEKLWINESSAAFNISLNVVGAITQSGNQVLHAGNYNSYSPTLTGGGASGTWGISITGSATTSGTVTHYSARTDVSWYNVIWGAGNPSYMYSCDAVQIQSSTGTLKATNFVSNQIVVAYGNVADTTNGSTWYGLGNAGNIHGNGANAIQLGGYFGVRIKTSGAIMDFYQGSAYYNSTFNSAVLQQAGNQVLHAANYSSYALPLGGGTMTGQIVGPSIGSDVYGGAIQIRERGYVLATQDAWSYSPAITFHWGNRWAKRFGGRYDGLFAIDDEPIALRSWVTSQGYITGYTETDTLATVTGRGNSTGSNIITSANSYANTFYDYYDNGYYFQGRGISRMYGVAIRGDNNSTSSENQIFFWGAGNTTTSAIGFKANGGAFGNPTGFGDGYNTYLTMDTDGRGWVFRRGVGGTDFSSAYTAGWILNNGVWQANASMRAPIFYDSQDTTYYGDFAGTSWLRHLSVGDVNSSNDAGWNARLNLTGSYHARLDVKSNSDGIITTIYSHTGQGVGRVGTMSNHPLAFMVNGSVAGYAYANYLQGVDSVRAPIFYDSDNTGYYGDFASTSRFNATITNTSYFGADTNKGYAQGFGTYSSTLHRIAYMSFDWDSNYNVYANHGIASTDINGSFSDSMSINSYNDITLRLDSNDNNGNSYLRISNNTTGSGTIAWIGYESGMNQNYFSGSVGISAGPRTDGYKLNMGGSIHLNGNSVDYVGSLYFNNAGHIQPNAGSYGSLQMTNAKNGWAGIRFTESEVNLMMNTNESGHYRNGYGWQFRWYNGAMYISTGANGGGSEYTVLHTGNAPRASNSNLVYYAGFTLNANTMPTNSTGFTYSDGAPTTGPIVRFGDGNYDLQFNAYYYWGDQLYYRTRNGDTGNWNSWHTIVTSSNIGSQSVSYAATAGNANSISGAVGGSYTWTATNYFRTNNGGYLGSLSSAPLQAYSDSNNSAYMSFHKGGHYAVNLGLDADNVMRIGGWSASANRWQLDMSGNMTVAGDVTAYSDARVKENVITVDNALSKVLALRGVYYNRTDSEDKNRKIGVIAQETMTVIPEVVNQDNAGMYNVSYGNLGGLFIEAIKEQQKKIDAQDKVIEELKSIINAFTK